MAFNGTRAPASQPLSAWTNHLARKRLAAKKARKVQKRQKALTAFRLEAAETLLRRIVLGADFLGEQPIENSRGRPEVHAFLLVALDEDVFRAFCAFGAELEDMEESCDDEGVIHTDDEHNHDGDEASLGSTMMVDQERWSECRGPDRFHGGPDNELDTSDTEPSLGAPETDTAIGVTSYSEGCARFTPLKALDQTDWARGSRLDLEIEHEDVDPGIDDGADYRLPGRSQSEEPLRTGTLELIEWKEPAKCPA